VPSLDGRSATGCVPTPERTVRQLCTRYGRCLASIVGLTSLSAGCSRGKAFRPPCNPLSRYARRRPTWHWARMEGTRSAAS
jgi:hypothetical protein